MSFVLQHVASVLLYICCNIRVYRQLLSDKFIYPINYVAMWRDVLLPLEKIYITPCNSNNAFALRPV